MTPGLTSIIIPTYNHAAYLADAIASALAQTAAVEVLVVDDGSTDDTGALLERYADQVRVSRTSHQGPSAARNVGIDQAAGEFVMFLDADDVIAPTKVAEQLAAFTPDVGWVLCDVRIEDEAKSRVIAASEQYDYAGKELGGWIEPQLAAGNFIPIMSPLVRRAVLGEHVRFRDDRVPEDWHFWCDVARAARVRYLPRALATYRHRRTGRSRLPKKARTVKPNITLPLRLNLGCGTPNTRSWHPIDGMVNLDKSLGWCFEDGLGDFIDGSVAGITVSHSLMYVAEKDWPYVFSEFARVLEPGGVIRITEDDAVCPASTRLGGWKGSQPAVTLTSPALVLEHLARVGLVAKPMTAYQTSYRDGSLRQAQHGAAPDVFFVEGTRPVGVLFSPHNDDETLFAAFTLIRHRPAVVVCYPSSGDYGSADDREAESRQAVALLGAGPLEQWHGGDLVAQMRALDARMHPSVVWAPHADTSHLEHRAVAIAAVEVFGARVVRYHTYALDAAGVPFKRREGTPVSYQPEWVERKCRALLRYRSQLLHPRAHQFFTWDLEEYTVR